VAVVAGVDHGRGFRREAGEVLAGVEPADVHVGRQEGLERDRRSDLAGADQVSGELIELLMDRLEEMLRLQEIGDPVECLVINDDGAEQRLLGLDVLRGVAVLRRGRFRQLAYVRIERCHDSQSKEWGVSKLGAVALKFSCFERTREHTTTCWQSQDCFFRQTQVRKLRTRTHGLAPGSGRGRPCLVLSPLPTAGL
jgi:hypothetical protein